MTAAFVAFWLGVALIAGIVIGIILGIAGFGERPPVGTLQIRYDEPEEEPYIFLELWKDTGDITMARTVNLVVRVTQK